MTENIILENVIDLVDNHYSDKPLVAEHNIIDNVSQLISENITLTREVETLTERIADYEENL